MARLTFALFGGFHATAGARLSIPSRKSQALLAYVAIRPGQFHSRDHLATLLWEGADEVRARQSLRQTLSSLRRALPRTRLPVLRTARDGLALNPAIEVDVRRFERLASRTQPASLQQALALYRGDLLAGFRLQEPLFDEWLRGERERLRTLAADALERLSTHQVSRALIDATLQTGLRLLAADPLQEAIHRALMRLYVQADRRPAAVNQYRICAETLQRELAIQPDAATTKLYRQIVSREPRAAPVAARRAGATARIPVVTGMVPLVGRATELARLERVLGDARHGRGGLATVSGEAGIGKTRLVQEVAARAAALGYQVVVGRCFESEQVLPFAPWVGLLRSEEMRSALSEVAASDARRRAELSRLLPELSQGGTGPATADGIHLRIFDVVARVVEMFSARQPVLLILEDVHWSDEMSVRLLVVLARQSRSWPLVLLASMRDDELLDRPVTRRLLAESDREGKVTALRLAPLAEADTLSLVGHLASKAMHQDAVARLGQQVWRLSEGHPFMVVETVRAVQEGASPETAEELPLARRIEELILGRLERLPARSQTVVGIAAVIGREFEYELLRRAAGVSTQAVAESLQDLVRRRVLQTVDERLAFTHDRIREVAYRHLLPPRQRFLHGAVARAMEAIYEGNLEPLWGTLGAHYREAGLWARAATCLRRAAPVALARGAFQEAAAYLEEALGALDRLPTGRATQEQMIEVRLELSRALMPLAEFDRMSACSGEAERAARALGDQYRLGWASALLSYTLWITGRRTRACELATRAEAIGEKLGDVRLTMNASVCLGAARVVSGEYVQAEPHLEKSAGTPDGDRSRGPSELDLFPPAITARCWLTVLCAELGQFDRGLARAREAVTLAEALDHPTSLSFACWALGYLWEARGRADEAIAPLERSLALADRWHLAIIWPLARAWLGSVYTASGRVSEGLALLHRSLEGYAPSTAGYPGVLAKLGHAYLLAGRPENALSSAIRASEVGREQNQRGSEAGALYLLGEIASRVGSADEAERQYHQAMSLAGELRMRPLLARCHLGLGRLLSRADKRGNGQQHLVTAAALLDEMGMQCEWLQGEDSLNPSR
jgi:DNA-binding SARP family transcriptional activator/tetratricopeptide (TPR) repeat protein